MNHPRSWLGRLNGEDALFIGRDWDTHDDLPVVLSVGYATTSTSVLSGLTRDQTLRTVEHGAVLSIHAGGTGTFGNDTAVASIDAAVEAYKTAFGPRQLPVLLIGLSMGFCDLLAWARTRPGDVIGAMGVVPLADLTEQWTANRDLGGGVLGRDQIDLAYGGTQHNVGTTAASTLLTAVGAAAGWVGQRIRAAGIPDGTTIVSVVPGVSAQLSVQATATANVVGMLGGYVPAVHGPTRNPTEYAAGLPFPVELFYTDDDPLIPPATITALAALPNVAAHSVGNLGHGGAACKAAGEHPAYGAFMDARAAARAEEL